MDRYMTASKISRQFILVLILFMLASPTLAEIMCTYCGEEISGEYVISQGNPYHKLCYDEHIRPYCEICGQAIEDKYTEKDGNIYHPTCFRDTMLEKCDICKQPLTATFYTDYWGNHFHTHHGNEYDECSSCGRLICAELTQGGGRMADGRPICFLCRQSSVSTQHEIESSLAYIKQQFRLNQIDGFPPEMPITLVDRIKLRQIATGYRENMQGFTDLNIQTRNGEVISRSYHIYILTGLPTTMFRAVLAHEMLHVYLGERDLNPPSDVSEGFCNLGSAMIYKLSDSEFAQFQLSNMDASKDPVYGYGYRKMAARLDKLGWRDLLQSIDSIR